MAQAHFDQFPQGDRSGHEGGISNFINGFGAILSLALIGAVVAWGYQLAVRDVSGVPVIRALEGPMRVQPDDPGGRAAENQGLAVNAVQAGGETRPADELTLAPTPVSLTVDDQTIAEFEAEEAAVASADTEIADALSTVSGDAEIRTAADLAVAAALAQDLLEDSVTIQDVVGVSSQAVTENLTELPGTANIVRPVLRPKRVLAPGTATDVDPSTLPLGTRLVQLGAFNSEDDARVEWTRLATGYDAFMSDKQIIIQRAENSGRVFYRLRAHGFQDLADARHFCAAIVASDASCIPVLTR